VPVLLLLVATPLAFAMDSNGAPSAPKLIFQAISGAVRAQTLTMVVVEACGGACGSARVMLLVMMLLMLILTLGIGHSGSLRTRRFLA